MGFFSINSPKSVFNYYYQPCEFVLGLSSNSLVISSLILMKFTSDVLLIMFSTVRRKLMVICDSIDPIGGSWVQIQSGNSIFLLY